jgi:hypothetical protein
MTLAPAAGPRLRLSRYAKPPRAWLPSVASGKAIQTSATAVMFLGELAEYWETRKTVYDRPGILESVKRGIRSLHPAKKPPTAQPTKLDESKPQSSG